MVLVDEARGDRLSGEMRPTHADVVMCAGFQDAAPLRRRSLLLIVVLPLETTARVFEYTIFSAACQIAANSRTTVD